ncbi:MAG: hypothetical protein H0V24_15275 [Chloroflexia bacterium]|nr:hypothetical protein [Chloroflexia bacterium]
MISALRGRVDAKLIDAVLVDVGGVVYRVNKASRHSTRWASQATTCAYRRTS